MSNACFWREEEMADLILGNLAEEKRVRLQRHLADCERCAALFRDWSAVLAPLDPRPQPSPSLKRRLLRRIACERWRSSILERLRTGSQVARAAVLLVCLVSLVGLFAVQRENVVPADLPDASVTRDVAMVMDPHTVLHVVPIVPGNVKSYVWINDTSNEMLILTDGLVPSAEIDYQVWFITEDRRSHVGLLHWQDGMAHLYFRGGELRQVENIAVSIEPKGGSFRPTGPDAIFVNLR
ncbi:anti-sigma factor domain-containing protein [Brevibacillus marinus]|uniref:anti-sigma factor domain-containing protein n=1 Tax=Brevibacillus marinus TaxID=2496837 RepID=UPI000F835739|nr:anti-sigma factor [Brevibacillus marinus]